MGLLRRTVRRDGVTIYGGVQHEDGTTSSAVTFKRLPRLPSEPAQGGEITARPDPKSGYFSVFLPADDDAQVVVVELTPIGRLLNRLTGWPSA